MFFFIRAFARAPAHQRNATSVVVCPHPAPAEGGTGSVGLPMDVTLERDATRRKPRAYLAPPRSHPVNGPLLHAPALLPPHAGEGASYFAALYVIAVVTMSATAVAQTPLSLAEAQRIAVERAPMIAAQGASIAAARELSVSARELPDPKLKLGLENLPIDGPDRYSVTRDFMTMRKIGVMQDFPRAEKRELRGRRADRQAEREQASFDETRTAVRRDVALAWTERYFAEAMAAAIDEQYAEAQLQLEAAEAGLRANKTPLADVIALRVSLQLLLDRRAEFEKQSVRGQAMLTRWLGDASVRPLAPLAADVVADATHDMSSHVLLHPLVRTRETEIQVAQSEAALARAATKPDWGLEFAYAQRGPQFSNMVTLQVSIDLPLFPERRQDRAVAAKLAQVEQARAVKEDALRHHLAEANAALAERQVALTRLKRFDDSLLPLASERTNLALAAYRGGQSSLSTVLEARRAGLELKLQKLQLEAELARTSAHLIYFMPEEHHK